MRTLILAAAVAAALALAAAAGAGGMATVGVNPLPSEEDDSWTPTLTILQHGRMPLDGLQPVIAIRNDETGETQSFVAKPTGNPGEYRAEVTFPGPGVWTYTINDDFSQVHTFKPVTIGGPAAAPGGSGVSLPWTVGGTAAILAALALLVLLGRRAGSRSDAKPAAAAP